MRGRVWLVLAAMTLAVAACGPGGPSYDDLAAEPVFATAMPDATVIGRGGSDPRGTIEGDFYGFATRLYALDEDAGAVLAWHRAAYEADGWTAVDHSPIVMSDGHFSEYAWQRGERIIGFGFPNRDRIAVPPGYVNAATVYEISITHAPTE